MIKKVECKKIKKLLQLYIDNDLTFSEKQMVEEHIKVCSTCRDGLKSLYYMVKIVGSLPEVPPLVDFMEKVISKIFQVKR